MNQLRPDRKGWQRFSLNIGGFTIKGCKWHSQRNSIRFPARYTSQRKRYDVIWTNGDQCKNLRALLESGKKRGPKDDCASPFTIQPFRWVKESRRWDGTEWVQREWLLFSFSLNGFKISGAWWEPQSGHIKMPVTILPRGYRFRGRYFRRKRQVVVAG